MEKINPEENQLLAYRSIRKLYGDEMIISDEEYKELLEWRKWEKILLEHPEWSLKIEESKELASH